ncbi:MAG: DUF3619 family protein [Burkholderiaceae bacterium]
MNEPAIAGRICRALDEELGQLPERVTARLAAAREAALARAPAPRNQAGARGAAAPTPAPAVRPAPRSDATWLRWLPAPVATVLFAGCLLAVWHWSDLRHAQERAALDVAILLADEVPLAAYADKGFGVYLRNTHR